MMISCGTVPRAALMALFACAALSPGGCGSDEATSAGDDHTVESYQLANGLTVFLRPVDGSTRAALVTLYGLGGDHDPPGRSGIGHLIEHLYVVSAAGPAKARTFEEFMKDYPAGWNAQTGHRYTVIATVFPADRLEAELADASARMADLDVTGAVLSREVSRVTDELANMYERAGPLAVRNHAHMAARPGPEGSRRGGRPEHVGAITPAEIRDRLKRYYKPRNALVVLAGRFRPDEAKKLIEERFGPLPSGQAAPQPGPIQKPNWGQTVRLTVPSLDGRKATLVRLAYAAPAPGDPAYAPFLVLLHRLWSSGLKLPSRSGMPPVDFPMLVDPTVISLGTEAGRSETPDAAVGRLQGFVSELAGRKLGPGEIAAVKNTMALHLGTVRLPDALVAKNLYYHAFAIGRRHQMGIDSAALTDALDRVTDADIQAAARTVFSADRRAVAVVHPAP